MAAGGVSPWAYVGSGTAIAIYISNESAVSMTFKVQASATAVASAGLNALNTTASGGLTWYDYFAKNDANDAVDSIVVGVGAAVCIDLAPYSPPFVRIVRTDGLADGAVTALVTSNGPN